MKVTAVDGKERVVVGTLAGPDVDGWVRLTDVTHAIDPRKPWEQSAEEEPEVLVRVGTVEPLDCGKEEA